MIGFIAFAGDQDGIARAGCQHRQLDGIFTIRFDNVASLLKACCQIRRGVSLYGGLFSPFKDLADDFSSVLSKLDSVILLEIYPAREQPIAGVSSEMLLQKINLKNKICCSHEEVLGILEQQRPEVLLTWGAGDIDNLVIPIKDAFTR